MVDAISTWLHVLAITLWIGPQVFLFAAAVPAVRTIEDAGVRARVLRVLTARFGWLGWSAMAVIIATGITNLFVAAGDVPGQNAGDLLSSDFRFTRIFWEKMFLVAVALVLTAVHTFSVGPRQLRLMEDASADEASVRRVRRLSMATSGIALLASIGALYLGAVLSNHDYSFVIE
ncbi:MAG TPA: CopD family protein [Dehalococcoidia bacterium]